jgi:M6 family metalloprotease-like protein
VLVVFGEFNDVAATPNVDAASIATQFFGSGFGSVADFYRASSFGKLVFTPAAENSGTANDGVVTVDLGSLAAFNANPADLGGYISVGLHGDAIRGRKIIEAANGAVNYATFDRNGNGQITDDELIVFLVQEGNPTTGDPNNCGATRPIKTGADLDGKSFPKQWSGGTTLTNTITHIHEISHQALYHNDHQYSAGRLDITGATCGYPITSFWDYNSWHKLHFGWTTPTVVSKDGYYTVGRWDTTGQSYLLYDPDKGTSNYFLVENRQPTASTYDQSAVDNGLVVWRVDDTRWGMAPPNPYQLMRPNQVAADTTQYDGGSDDAWDPSDSQTTQRTMSRTWSDGTASNVAMRAIGPSGATVRVYFDVRGPGVLVDPSAAVTDVTMLQANPVSYPVMNTGEATDTFAFTLTSLPAGWSATSPSQSLGAGATGTATVQLTVPGNTPTGNYTLQATGTSTTDGTVTSSSPITVQVLKRATTLVYGGSTTGDYSDSATVSATLTDNLTGNPIAGKSIDFALGTQSTSPDPTTNVSGVASDSITVTQASGSVNVVSSFAGDGTYLASDDTDGFTITKETLSFVYTGSTLVALGTSPTLSSTATEEADGSPGNLSLAGATFTLTPTLTTTPFSYTTGVSAAGLSSTAATGLPVDVWSVTVAVPASNQYWEGTTAAATELVLFDPAAKFTGSAAGRDAANAAISVSFDYRYDKSLKPRGTLTLRYSGGTFTGRDPVWIVQVGSVAIVQTTGTLNGATRSARLRFDDNAEPPRPDTFRAKLGSYDSGTVTVTSGNLQSHPT